MTNSILVYIEINNNIVEKVSKEIICYIKNNIKGFKIIGVTLGNFDKNIQNADDIKSLGLDCLHIISSNLLEQFDSKIYADAICPVINDIKPDIMLMGATVNGRELAPRLASKLNIGLTADCTALDIDEKADLLATRPTYGGQMMAVIKSKTKPNFATIRAGAFKYEQVCGETRSYNFVEYKNENIQQLLTVIKKTLKHKNKDWTCSDIIIAGGLGLQNKDNFDIIYQLCDKIGAKPAASRSAVERGWALESIQVGQTGSSVSPKIYLAIGISGALQHLCGITNADKIIAINTDPNAPIMTACDIAIVADGIKLLKQLIADISD